MAEADLDDRLRELLMQYRLFGFSVHDMRHATGKGWPDWTILGKRILFRELKGLYDLSPEQNRVRDLLLAAGQDWDVWRRRDFESGKVETELIQISRWV